MQLPILATTLMVAMMGVLVVLDTLKELILPEPEEDRPIVGLSFVQVIVAPVEVGKSNGPVLSPEQRVVSVGPLKMGVAFTVIFLEVVVKPQELVTAISIGNMPGLL